MMKMVAMTTVISSTGLIDVYMNGNLQGELQSGTTEYDKDTVTEIANAVVDNYTNEYAIDCSTGERYVNRKTTIPTIWWVVDGTAYTVDALVRHT